MGLKKWSCFVCGDEVIEGQKFTFIDDSAVHLHCLERFVEEKLLGQPTKIRTAFSLIRALDISATALVGYKTLKLASKDKVLFEFLEKLQRDEERISTLITGELKRLLD